MNFRFLWVEFQLAAICAECSDKGIERALKRVPDDMNATYKRILNTINAKPRSQREIARKIIIWTAYARQRLSINDLAYIISVETDTKSQKDLESSIPAKRYILDACANLISVNQSSNRYVQFVHFSAQEFLTSEYATTLNIGYEVAHREIAQMCMIFLNLFPNGSRFPRLDSYVFLEWPRHILAGNLNNLQEDDPIVALTLSFFKKGPVLVTEQPKVLKDPWSRKLHLTFSLPVLAQIFDLPGIQKCWSLDGKQLEEKQPNATFDYAHRCIGLSEDKLAIHYATAELDSVPVVRRLYNHGYSLTYSYSDPNGGNEGLPDWLLVPPLFSVQSTQMATFLLDNSISTEPQILRITSRRSLCVDPLEYFSRRKNWEVFRVLLDRAIAQNDGRLNNFLQVIISNHDHNIELIRLLLDRGVNINAQGGRYGNALQAAVFSGKIDVIQLLLDKGADINAQSGEYGSALQAAVVRGNIKVIRLLLDMGADVNTQGGKYGNAFTAAIDTTDMEIIELLLEKGANVNAQDEECGSALLFAVAGNNIDVIRLLLGQGADINAQGGWYGNALHTAVYCCKIDVIQLLLDWGADVNAEGGALQSAVLRGKTDVIQLLLGKGADVNTQGGNYGNALQAALCHGNNEVIRLLLDKGADVMAQGGKYSNALEAAICGHAEIRPVLLNKRAGVYTWYSYAGQAVWYSYAGQAAWYSYVGQAVASYVGAVAESYGNVEAVRLLLDRGIGVNSQAGEYGNILQATAFYGQIGVIRLLLDKGADVNAQGGIFGTALQAAAYHGNIDVIQLLLHKGADINMQGGIFGTVLQTAAYKGNIEVIQLLLQKGADIYARGGKYGAVLKQMLIGKTAGAEQTMPGDIPLLVELLKEHAPRPKKHSPESEYEVIATKFENKDRWDLDAFRELLESWGWRRRVQSSREVEGVEDEIEGETKDDEKNEDEIKDQIEDGSGGRGVRGEIEGVIEGVIEDEIEGVIKDETENGYKHVIEGSGTGSGNETSQELQALNGTPTVKLFEFSFLVFLLYILGLLGV